MGDGHSQLIADKLGRFDVRSARLLKIEDVVLLNRPAKLYGGLRIEIGMVFHDDVHIGANGLPDGCHPLFDHVDLFRRQQAGPILVRVAVSVFRGKGKEVDFDAVVALGHRLPGVLHIVGNGARIVRRAHFHAVTTDVPPSELELAGISTQIVPALAAQQLVDGYAEVFALDIPEGDVQRGNAGENHGAAILSPESGLVELVPDDFVIQGIHTDDKGGQIPDHACGSRCGSTIGQSGFPITIDSLVGIDAAEHRPPRGTAGMDLEYVYLRDFHTDNPPSNNLFLTSCSWKQP